MCYTINMIETGTETCNRSSASNGVVSACLNQTNVTQRNKSNFGGRGALVAYSVSIREKKVQLLSPHPIKPVVAARVTPRVSCCHSKPPLVTIFRSLVSDNIGVERAAELTNKNKENLLLTSISHRCIVVLLPLRLRLLSLVPRSPWFASVVVR